MEHRAFGYDKLDALAFACRATGHRSDVRVQKTGYESPMRALESGANRGLATGSLDSVQEAIEAGARLVTAGNDHSILVRGFQNVHTEFRHLGQRV